MSLEGLGEGHESVTSKFKSIEDLSTAYQHLQKKLGNSVPIPETEAEWAAFYERTNIPKTLQDYGGDTPESRIAKDMKLTSTQFEQLKKALNQGREKWSEFAADLGEDFDTHAAQAKLAAEKMGVELTEDPALFKVLSEVGKNLTNDQAPGSSAGAGPTGPQRIAQRLRELITTPAYQDRKHQNVEEAAKVRAEADGLYAQLYEQGFSGPYDSRLNRKQ